MKPGLLMLTHHNFTHRKKMLKRDLFLQFGNWGAVDNLLFIVIFCFKRYAGHTTRLYKLFTSLHCMLVFFTLGHPVLLWVVNSWGFATGLFISYCYQYNSFIISFKFDWLQFLGLTWDFHGGLSFPLKGEQSMSSTTSLKYETFLVKISHLIGSENSNA